MATRPTMKAFKKKALSNRAVQAEYDALSAVFEMKRQMIIMRKSAGLTQKQMAELLGTADSNISRLESISSEVSPTISTIEQYAHALGYVVKIEFKEAG